jgi:SAM-dependent methyltransferase
VEPESDVDQLVRQVKERVERRRRDGAYPDGIEEDLESRFAALRRAALDRRSFAPLEVALDRQRDAGHFTRDRIDLGSEVPGGASIHRAVGATVRRQVDGLLAQMQDFSDAVNETSDLLGSMLGDPPFHHHDDLHSGLDMLDDRVTRLERARAEIGVVAQRVEDLHREVQAIAASPPDIDWTRFARRFRGDAEELLDRYRGVADRFEGLGPVVDVGCGDGGLLSLLAERGVESWGIESDPAVARVATGRGHTVRVGDGVEVLRNLGDETLGGVVLIQVIEHLPPATIPGVIGEVARALKPGGVLYIETPNPMSLFVHSHSLWLDPSHTRPLHPLYLEFVCRAAGLEQIEIVYSSPVPDDQKLPGVADDGSELAATMSAVVERLNQVVFGPQDYAIVATR